MAIESLTPVIIPLIVALIGGAVTFYLTMIKSAPLIEKRLNDTDNKISKNDEYMKNEFQRINSQIQAQESKIAVITNDVNSIRSQVKEHTEIYRDDMKELGGTLEKVSNALSELNGTMQALKEAFKKI